MKYYRHVIGTGIIAALAAFSCSEGRPATGAVRSAQTEDAGAGEGTTVAVCSDAQALAIALTANQSEIDEANAALPLLLDENVRVFAQQMIDDHTKLRDVVAAAAASTTSDPDTTPTGDDLVIVAEPNAISAKLQQESRNAIGEITAAGPDDVDKVYLDHEILGHLQTLGLLEHLVVPSVTKQNLAMAIASGTPVVTMHSTLALQIQSQLEGQCGGQGESPTPPPDRDDAGTGDNGDTSDPGDPGDPGDNGGGSDLRRK